MRDSAKRHRNAVVSVVAVCVLAAGVFALLQSKPAAVQRVAWIWPDSNGPRTDASPPYGEAAVLVESLVLRAQGVERGGRSEPLHLPAHTAVLPVVHIEAAGDAPDAITLGQRDAVLAAVRRHAQTAAAGAGVLQIDFEAPSRQRDSYRELVAAARDTLPPGVRLSVTVLAHWCTQGWLDTLPADELVPMLYRLGPQAPAWRDRFERGDPHLSTRCLGPALGFATNDPPPARLLARASRVYWFDQNAWANPSRPPAYLYP